MNAYRAEQRCMAMPENIGMHISTHKSTAFVFYCLTEGPT